MKWTFLEGHVLLPYQQALQHDACWLYPLCCPNHSVPWISKDIPYFPFISTEVYSDHLGGSITHAVQWRACLYCNYPNLFNMFYVFRISCGCQACSESIFRNIIELCMHICHVLTGHIHQNKRKQQIMFRQRFGSRPSPAVAGKTTP